MSTPKHTPGPWIVHTFTVSGKEKLEVLNATGTNACVQANAHLIAAAPAMYEALKAIVGQQTPNRWGYDAAEIALSDEWRAQARAALAQAEAKS